MSVTSEDNKVSYVASGSETYPIPFYFSEKAHIKLYVDDTELELNTDFTVTGEGDSEGGVLTLVNDPFEDSEVVLILREVPVTQEDTLTESGPNSSRNNERRFDKLTMIAQQLKEQISRAIKFPLASTFNPQILGTVTPGAVIKVGADGESLEMGQSLESYASELEGYAEDAEEARELAVTAQEAAETALASAVTAQEAAADSATAAAASAASITDMFGDQTVDDSFRFHIEAGVLKLQKRVLGSWNTITDFNV